MLLTLNITLITGHRCSHSAQCEVIKYDRLSHEETLTVLMFLIYIVLANVTW